MNSVVALALVIQSHYLDCLFSQKNLPHLIGHSNRRQRWGIGQRVGGPDPGLGGFHAKRFALENTVPYCDGRAADFLDVDFVGDLVEKLGGLDELHRELDRGQALAGFGVDDSMGVDAKRREHLDQAVDHPDCVVGEKDDAGRIALAPLEGAFVSIGSHGVLGFLI